jgi:hypothetical protein
MLLAILGSTAGCGRSPGHVRVSVGDSARLDVNRLKSGRTSVQLRLRGSGDGQACRPMSIAMTWQDVAAQLRAC